jgi:pyruvate carboxylase subunit B
MATKKTKKIAQKKSPAKKNVRVKPSRPSASRAVQVMQAASPEFRVTPAPGKKLLMTEVALRDGHQCLLATRMRTEDMLPIAQKLDAVGFWSLEVWGGATFDTCLRFLKEDPWERLRALRAAMPKTKLQMLLRGQNLVGYRHYADDVLEKFIERSAFNGIDVFRIFDALNDVRNSGAGHP